MVEAMSVSLAAIKCSAVIARARNVLAANATRSWNATYDWDWLLSLFVFS
jgi:hypothetical protein